MLSSINASISNASWLENMGWYNHLWEEPLLPKNGMVTPLNKPGHGLTFKKELYKEFQYKRI